MYKKTKEQVTEILKSGDAPIIKLGKLQALCRLTDPSQQEEITVIMDAIICAYHITHTFDVPHTAVLITLDSGNSKFLVKLLGYRFNFYKKQKTAEFTYFKNNISTHIHKSKIQGFTELFFLFKDILDEYVFE